LRVKVGTLEICVKGQELMSMTKKPELLNDEKALKAYSQPKLVHYGKVEEITKGSTGSQHDFGSAMQPGM
jgi:hypothetical protein